jgi:hypothetical protein
MNTNSIWSFWCDSEYYGCYWVHKVCSELGSNMSDCIIFSQFFLLSIRFWNCSDSDFLCIILFLQIVVFCRLNVMFKICLWWVKLSTLGWKAHLVNSIASIIFWITSEASYRICVHVTNKKLLSHKSCWINKSWTSHLIYRKLQFEEIKWYKKVTVGAVPKSNR